MLKEIETYTGLPEPAKQIVLALSIIMSRVGELPKGDQDDLYDLVSALRECTDPEEARSIHRAMEEILAQVPIEKKPLVLDDDKPISRNLKNWTLHVAKKIRQLREEASLTQVELAEKAELTQSHISRLERAEHSPTHYTLAKIAKALGVEVSSLDPASD